MECHQLLSNAIRLQGELSCGGDDHHTSTWGEEGEGEGEGRRQEGGGEGEGKGRRQERGGKGEGEEREEGGDGKRSAVVVE